MSVLPLLIKSTLNDHIGILNAAGDAEESPKVLRSSFKVALPSSSSIGMIWPESQRVVALPYGLQRTVTSPLTALYLGFCLLETLVESCFADIQKSDDHTIFENLRPWALSRCVDLWNSFIDWNFSARRVSLHDDIVRSYIQSLSILALPDTSREKSWSLDRLTTLTSGLLDVIRCCISNPFSQANQARLAYVLIRLQDSVEETCNGVWTNRCVTLPPNRSGMKSSYAKENV